MSTKRKRRRRSPGEGAVWPYKTKAGRQRYAIGYTVIRPDGTARTVTRRRGKDGKGWTKYADAAKAVAAEIAAVEAGTWADRPGRQPATTSMSGPPGCGWHRPRWPATGRTSGCTSSRTSGPCRWPG